ncbi:unnamed protein product, partial [Mesorhabditis spiculigera]
MDELIRTLVTCAKINICICCVFVTALLHMYTRILNSKTFCHPNLRFLLLCQPWANWIGIFSKTLWNLIDLFAIPCEKTFYQFIQNLTLMSVVNATCMMLPISFERLIATAFPEKYDLSNFLSLGVYSLCFRHGGVYQEFTKELFYFWIAILVCAQMVLTVLAHEVPKQELFRMLGRQTIVGSDKAVPLSINGERMIFTPAEERERYFRMYTQAHDTTAKGQISTWQLVDSTGSRQVPAQTLPMPELMVFLICAKVIICFSLIFLTILLQIYTRILSRYLFRKAVAKRSTSLAERYQTLESVRSAHLLKYISIYKTTTNFLSFFLYFLCFNVAADVSELTADMFYFWIVVQVSAQMVLTVMAHEVPKQELFRMLGRRTIAASDNSGVGNVA